VIALLLMVTLPAYAWAVLGLPDDQHPCKAGQECKTAHAQGMQDMPMKDMPTGANSQDRRHHASGTVKKLDASVGTVTFAHGPVKSLNWPAMTMNFRVKDKALLDKLAVGTRAEFEFVQEGSDYVVTAVR
jgi:Cu(I)/Ag(I) efflux system protein CusF